MLGPKHRVGLKIGPSDSQHAGPSLVAMLWGIRHRSCGTRIWPVQVFRRSARCADGVNSASNLQTTPEVS